MAILDSLKGLKLIQSVKAVDNISAAIKTLSAGDVSDITIRTGVSGPAPEGSLASATGDINLDIQIRDSMTLHLNLKGVQIILDD